MLLSFLSPVSGNLPPKVDGLVRGFLNVSCKKLRWIENRVCSSSALVQLKWWGEEANTKIFLRPDSKCAGQREATYAIRCSLKNFGAYTTDVGVLTIYLVSENGQVFGCANVDKFPSSERSLINTCIAVLTDTGQQIARVSLVFKLEETDMRGYATPHLPKHSNVQDTIAALLITSHKLQKSMTTILEDSNKTGCLEKLQPGRKPVDCDYDEIAMKENINSFKILDYPEMFLSPKDYALGCTANADQERMHGQRMNSLRSILFSPTSKSNKEPVKKAGRKIGTSNVPIKRKSLDSLKVNSQPSEPGVINANCIKDCCVSNKCGPLMHCLLSIPNGDGPFHPVARKYSNAYHNEDICHYLVIRMLWRDIFCSDVTSNGIFAFHQVTSVQISHELLKRMHNNFISIEVWEKRKEDSDKIIGICKLPVHLFYLTFRDVVMTDNSANSKQHAIVAVDDKLPVEDLFSGKILGQLQVLFAMGTELQINQLQESIRSSPHSNNSATEQTEHVFEITIHVLKLYRPPLSTIWGESDCFVQYMFPDQDVHAKHPDSHLYLTKHTVGPCLCQDSIQFKTTLKHAFLSPESSLHGYISQAFPLNKLPLQVWCRYHPSEEDRLVAVANIPLSSLFSLISSNDYMKIFNLNLEAINMNSTTSNKTDDIGFMEVHINYSKSRKPSEYMAKPREINRPSTVPAMSVFSVGETEDHLTNGTEEFFLVLIKIEGATHLPNIQLKSSGDYLPPNGCITVSYTGRAEDIMKTCTIQADANPRWNFEGEVQLPIDLLIPSHKNLIFRIWHVEDESLVAEGKKRVRNQSEMLIGLVYIDLSPLLCGMHQLSGWYDIIDCEGLCKGQVKISINPLHCLETISKMTRIKESELAEDFKMHPLFHQSRDSTRAQLVDDLRNKLTRLESIQFLMEQMLKRVSLQNERRESPEVISCIVDQMNELIHRGSDEGKISANEALLSSTEQVKNDSCSTNSLLLTAPNGEVIPVHEDGMPLIISTNDQVIKTPVKRHKSRVAAAIFHSEADN